jgi:hypothetical protein
VSSHAIHNAIKHFGTLQIFRRKKLALRRPSNATLSRGGSAVLYILAGGVTYFLSHVLLTLYTAGDQIYYHAFYNALAYAPLSDVTPLQVVITGSVEPIYGYLMWIGSTVGIEKNVYISVFNAFLAILLIAFLRRSDASPAVIALLLLNFYFIVLLTSAERLKFSVLLLLAAAMATKKSKHTLLAAAHFAHLQTIIFTLSLLFSRLKEFIQRSRSRREQAISIVVASCVIGVIWWNSGELLLEKLSFYIGAFVPSDLVPTAILFLVGAIVLRTYRRSYFTGMIPIVAATAALGGSRTNMIGFMFLTYMVATEQRTRHPVFVGLLVYFTIKSLGYFELLMATGSGFIEIDGE